MFTQALIGDVMLGRGVDACSLATNHALDFEAYGLRDTLVYEARP